MRLFCVGVSRLSLACAFVRPESEQNSSRLQTDVPLPCRLDLGTFPMQQICPNLTFATVLICGTAFLPFRSVI
jgi:hypothetical protein